MYRIIGGDGNQYGPINAEQLRQWLAEGRVNAQTQVQAEGDAEWRPLSAFPDLAAAVIVAPPPRSAPPAAKVPNYLVQAILVTLCCCLPLGIPAIIFAAQVNGKLAAGDVAGGLESSRKAKLWCWWAFGLGLAAQLAYVIFYAVMMGMGFWQGWRP